MRTHRWQGIIYSFILLTSIGLYLLAPDLFTTLNTRINDLFPPKISSQKISNKVSLVDIDDRSLHEIGQWPWSRDKMAKLISILHKNGARYVALDIVFPEPDRTSPAYLNRTLHLHLPHPQDYDAMLSKAIAETPTLLGYLFDMSPRARQSTLPKSPAIVIERGTPNHTQLYHPRGALFSLPVFREGSASEGFITVVPDPSGIIRDAPLVMAYRGRIFPSWDLELARLIQGGSPLILTYGKQGLERLAFGDKSLPVDAKGRLRINFRLGTTPHLSAVDLLHGKHVVSDINGSAVLIGSSASALQDVRATPTQAAMPGIDIHAAILRNLLGGTSLIHPEWINGINLVGFVVVLTLSYWVLLQLQALPLLGMTLLFGVILGGAVYGLRSLYHLDIDIALPFFALGLGAVSALVLHYFQERKQRHRTHATLAKHVSPHVASTLLQSDTPMARTVEATILFSDVRNFTSLSESIDNPQALMDLLNHYTHPMSAIITEHHGIVDKYIGDGIMAYWNAPDPLPQAADHAVRAALAQCHQLEQINQDLERKFGHTLQIGIGIHTGEVTLGEVGGDDRVDFTLIGENVNIASRVEAFTKTHHNCILITQSTKDRLIGHYDLRPLGDVSLRGIHTPISLYEVRKEIP